MSADWLPSLVTLEASGGNWPAYEETLYHWFSEDFLRSLPAWPDKPSA